jgi:signal peptidase I
MNKSGSPRQPLFEGLSGSQMWVENTPRRGDSNVLVTISNQSGEHSVLVTPTKIVDSKAKVFVQAPPERVLVGVSKTRKRISNFFVGFGYVLAVVLLTFSAASATGLVKARIVLTGSMTPTINPGDIVITTSPLRVQPKLHSIIAYQARRFDGAPVGVFTHRIIGGDPVAGFMMKGDHNPNPDVQRPKGADVLGTVIYVLPFIGNFLTKKALFIIVPTGVGLWFLFDTLKDGSNDR